MSPGTGRGGGPNRSPGVVLVAGLVLFGLLVSAGAAARRHPVPAPPEPPTLVRDAPVVGETPANLESAFANEMNAKERYVAFAKRADSEDHPEVARLFRACSEAEAVHARRHTQAIMWAGGHARVLLARVDVRTTAWNLQAAIDNEIWEVDQFYPALLARARADHSPESVRSMTFALATERGHVKLLQAALGGLSSPGIGHSLFVCRGCGNTVESITFTKCPNCFSPARRFMRIT